MLNIFLTEKSGRKRKGFIGNVSPIKRSKKGSEYCEFSFTSEDRVERGVCFSMKVRKDLLCHSDSNKPCKVENIGGDDDLIFTSQTSIEELKADAVSFTRESVTSPTISIADIESIKIRGAFHK